MSRECADTYKQMMHRQTASGYIADQGGLPGTPDLCQTWFKKASDQGIAEASYKLGQCFEDGWGCAKSLSEAVRLYNIAAHGMSWT